MRAIKELIEVLQQSLTQEKQWAQAVALVVECLKSGGKVMTCGNGGSATDACHLAEELTGRYNKDRKSLPGFSLAADSSTITCIGNDYGYDHIFSRQVEGLGRSGDLLVGFSTSGNSVNINKAIVVAKEKGIHTILLTGKDGGVGKELADCTIIVPSSNTARIQEVHTLILHEMLEAVEARIDEL